MKKLWGMQAAAPRTALLLITALAALALAVLAPVSALAVRVLTPPTHTASLGLSWLTTSGSSVVNANGDVVTLRGFNTDALLDYSAWTPSPINESDAVLMQGDGFDVVRIGISWSAIEPTRHRFDQSYIDRIQAMVNMFAKHGIYSVLEMHFLDWGPQFDGVGAPRWATVPLVPDIEVGPDLAWRRHLSPAVNAAFGYFWASDDWQQDFRASWQQVATRFANDSSVVGYDLFNEPHPLPAPPIWFEKHQLWPMYQKTIQAIAQVDSNHIFIVEGDFFGGWPTTIVPLTGARLIYSAHFYTGSLIPPIYSGDPTAIESQLSELEKEAGQLGAPLWIGETGIDSQSQFSNQWIKTFINGTASTAGWAWWQWKEPNLFGLWSVFDQNGVLNAPLLSALATPYFKTKSPGVSAVATTSEATVTTRGGPSPSHVNIGWPFSTDGSPHISSTCDTPTVVMDSVGGAVSLTIPAGSACTVTLDVAASSL